MQTPQVTNLPNAHGDFTDLGGGWVEGTSCVNNGGLIG